MNVIDLLFWPIYFIIGIKIFLLVVYMIFNDDIPTIVLACFYICLVLIHYLVFFMVFQIISSYNNEVVFFFKLLYLFSVCMDFLIIFIIIVWLFSTSLY